MIKAQINSFISGVCLIKFTTSEYAVTVVDKEDSGDTDVAIAKDNTVLTVGDKEDDCGGASAFGSVAISPAVKILNQSFVFDTELCLVDINGNVTSLEFNR